MRPNRLFLSLLVTLTLVSPAAAVEPPWETDALPTCGTKNLSNPSSPLLAASGPGTYQALQAEERLFHPLHPGETRLEVKVRVDGEEILVETIDLQSAAKPRASSSSGVQTKRGSLAERIADGGEMVELLSLRPALVRDLRAKADAGAQVLIDVASELRGAESFRLDELVARSHELAAEGRLPLVVEPRYEGSAADGRPAGALRLKTYLEDCGDCTTSTPCETECGYDEGKGGPVTCGEYGICEPATCECEWVSYEYWTDLYYYGSAPVSPPSYQCYQAFGGGSRWHELWADIYRRDRIQRKQICPNCPSCSGCYIEETVIAYQLYYSYCWQDTGPYCTNGSLPCCSELCFVGGLTPCNNYC